MYFILPLFSLARLGIDMNELVSDTLLILTTWNVLFCVLSHSQLHSVSKLHRTPFASSTWTEFVSWTSSGRNSYLQKEQTKNANEWIELKWFVVIHLNRIPRWKECLNKNIINNKRIIYWWFIALLIPLANTMKYSRATKSFLSGYIHKQNYSSPFTKP